MKSLVLLSVLLAAAQALPSVEWASLRPHHIGLRLPFAQIPKSRIVGGTLAKAGEFPFQVGMFMDGSFFCGGSLIREDLVLSAAHCVKGTRVFDVYLGSLRVSDDTEEGRVHVNTRDGLAHERYNSGQLTNDIALVRLGVNVTLNERIQLVRLAKRSAGELAGEVGVVSGWGQETDESPSIAEDLQYTPVTLMSNSDCSQIWGSIPDTQLCVDTNGGENTPCFGDSGGPLTITENEDKIRSQVGVVSYVSGSGCESGVPSVFTRVTEYVDWVQGNGGPAARP